MIAKNIPSPPIGAFPHGSAVKESTCDAGDMGSSPGSVRSPGGGHGNPPQYSCLENPMDRGTWWATVHRVPQRCARLKQLSMHAQHLEIMGKSKYLRSMVEDNLGIIG